MTAYSVDFRKKIIQLLAKRFLISPDTVRRLLKQYRLTGDVTPQKCGSKRKSVLSQYEETVFKMVEEHPDLTLWQYCEHFREETGVDVGTSMMDRFFQQHNLRLKKNLSEGESSYCRSATISSRLLG
jgi:transposase